MRARLARDLDPETSITERTVGQMPQAASELHGVGVGRGAVVGPVLVMSEALSEPLENSHSGDADAEKAAVAAAVNRVVGELRARADRAAGPGKHLIEAAIQMAQDPILADGVGARIEGGASGERAVFEAFRSFQQQLIALGPPMAERATDLADVCQRIVAALRGAPAPGIPVSDAPFILLVRDLAPADTALLDARMVLGLITRDGGPTGHTAILARDKAIPAVVGIGAEAQIAAGTRVVVDAASGTVIVAPSDAQVAAAELRITERATELATRATGGLSEGALADGTSIPLLANLGSPRDAARAVELGAEGVGLFRTELLHLDARTAPTVAQQQSVYTELLSHFPGHKVVVRMFDSGADKPLAFLPHAHEQNPALGVRGVRALRAEPQILADQLQALKNAQDVTDADLWVMAPMVADAVEARFFVDAGKRLGLRMVGVMAEVPSLALLAEQVLAAADFVSIGTNDLTQYALAADRMLGTLSAYQDPWHPAVLRLVKLLGDAGAAAGKPVGICGEAAADPRLAVVLVGLGATSLSMAPPALAEVRAELAGVTLEQARTKAAAALAADSAERARAASAGA